MGVRASARWDAQCNYEYLRAYAGMRLTFDFLRVLVHGILTQLAYATSKRCVQASETFGSEYFLTIISTHNVVLGTSGIGEEFAKGHRR